MADDSELTPDLEWSDAQKEEIVEGIKGIRKSTKNSKIFVHGWKIEWTLRDSAIPAPEVIVMIDQRWAEALLCGFRSAQVGSDRSR